jgi:hypothetical protein
MPPRLKVFVTSDGLTEFAVAVSSKAKALAAWGVRQDLFKEGLARETDDPNLVAQAQARPGEVLRRPAAGRAEMARLKPARRSPRPAAKPAPPPKPAGPSKAVLAKIAALERQLTALDAEHRKAAADLERERTRLENRAKAQETDYAARRGKLDAALTAARRAPG